MHRSPGSSKFVSVVFAIAASILLTACAGPQPAGFTSPSSASDSAAASSPLAARARSESSVDVQGRDVANVDIRQQPADDLWQRMRAGFAMPDLTTQAAAEKTAWYAARSEYLKRSFERARPFLFHIVEELEKRGMPTEIALLPLVESSYNPRAVSSAQAAGMWQFIPSTGKHYKLTQDWWRDDRRDIIASTSAALDYLQMLHGMFNDWHLALAAYNWGEGAVGRAVAKARANGEPADYASLRMPAETAGYIPKLQAVKNIVMNAALYNVALPQVPNAPYFATITKTRDIDVKTAARFADMPVEEFLALNPAHNRPVIPGANRPVLVLPADRIDTFKQNLENHGGKPISSWQAHLVKAGEKLEAVAARFGIDVASLRSVNGLGARTGVKPGHTLLVPKDGKAADARNGSDAAERLLPVNLDQPAVLMPARLVKTAYVVRTGDTLAGIAKKYQVSGDDIKKWNKLAAAGIAPGQKLVIEQMVAAKEPGRRVAAKSVKKGKAVQKPKRAIKVARR